MKTRLMLAGVLAVGGLFAVSPQAQASSTCAKRSPDPVSVDQTADGGQVCYTTGTLNGALTVTPSYAAVDGADRNPEPADGYLAVDDSSGPSGCASGDYQPGGANNPVIDPAPSDECTPQTAGY